MTYPVVNGGYIENTLINDANINLNVQRTLEDKLKDYISVKDFGAIGDGVTDDTSAIQNAINSDSYVYFPKGNYLITDIDIMMTNRNGDAGANFLYKNNSFPVGDITGFTNLPVPSIFANIQDALNYAESKSFIGSSAFCSISIDKGTYSVSQIVPAMPNGYYRLQFVGSTGTASDVVLNFDNSNNKCGFLINNGNSLYKIADLTINGLSSDGSNGWQSHGVWKGDCAGAAIMCDNASTINFVSNVVINKFYYGIKAIHNSYIGCNSVTVTEAGDCGYHAWKGATIEAPSCSASYCADTANSLGGGFVAELNSTIRCEGATSNNNAISGFSVITMSSMWAQGSSSSYNSIGYYANAGGSLIADYGITNNGSTSTNNTQYGFYALGAFISANGATSSNNGSHGFYANKNAWIAAIATTSKNNSGDGYHSSDNSTLDADASTSSSNAECGFYSEYGGLITAANPISTGNNQWGYRSDNIGSQRLTDATSTSNNGGDYSPNIGNTGNNGSWMFGNSK